jgi:tetratricopeptide (TPR) repeat protein
MSDVEIELSLGERAIALQNAGRLVEAVELYRAQAKTRLTVNLARNLGAALFDLGQFDEAERWTSLAARNGAGDANLRVKLGHIYAARGRNDLAELEYRTALALKPGLDMANWSLANLYLSVGRYAEGWPLMQARVALRPDVVPAGPTSYPEWQGEPLAGKTIFIHHEQGFGDQIQTCRFVAMLKQRGASKVTLGCRPPLAALLENLDAVDAVVPMERGGVVNIDRHDYWSRYFSLPRHLGITLENLPNAPYVTAPADRRARWRGMSGVGLSWRSSLTGSNASNKNLTPADARKLLDLGAVSLHPEDTGAEDFADTAAIIEQLDLVISIDTSVAHLAGAMGKPCWTLLPYLKLDWRWMHDRADSPWYPSMRLFRRSDPDNWDSVMTALLADLAARTVAS